MSEDAELSQDPPKLAAGQLNGALIRPTSPGERASELFLSDLKERTEKSARQNEIEIRSLATREKVIFGVYVAVQCVAVLLIVAGLFLVAFHLVAFAVVSGIVGVLGGTGSVTIKRAADATAQRRRVLSEREDEDAWILRTIGITLMIPDGVQREASLAALAARLVDKIGPDNRATRPRQLRNAARSEHDGIS